MKFCKLFIIVIFSVKKSDTKITLHIDQGGAAGNLTNAITTTVPGDHDIVDVRSFTGGNITDNLRNFYDPAFAPWTPPYFYGESFDIYYI